MQHIRGEVMESTALYFRPEPKKTLKKKRLCNIRTSKKKLGAFICSRMLFVHAILSCDKTFRPYGIGKPVALFKIHGGELPKIANFFMEEMLKRRA